MVCFFWFFLVCYCEFLRMRKKGAGGGEEKKGRKKGRKGMSEESEGTLQTQIDGLNRGIVAMDG